MKRKFDRPEAMLISLSVSDCMSASDGSSPVFTNQLSIWDESISIGSGLPE